MNSRMRPLAAILLCLALGCARQTAQEEEHEEEHRTGSHGGALVTLSEDAIRSAGIAVDTVGPQSIDVVVELPGEVKLNAERSVDVKPTYPGTVRQLNASLGAYVHKGQPIAVIYSNESLSEYVLEAPMGGTVVTRPVNTGATVDRETVLYTVADLGSVWLDVPIYVQHLGRIRVGQTVHVRTDEGSGPVATGTIRYVGPVLDADTRATFARVVLPNPGRRWQPGRLVTASVALERVTVPLSVPEAAVVRMGTGAAVFRADSVGFEVQPITVGRSDGTNTEVLSGLEGGARVVSRNAFLLKAELEKEAGGHED